MRSGRILLPAHLDKIRLWLLVFTLRLLLRAIKSAPKKKVHKGSGILPSPLRFISLVRDLRKFSPAVPFDLLSKSLKNSETSLSGSAPEPFEKKPFFCNVKNQALFFSLLF